MTKKRKYFGTDGIRGKVGVAPISADWALKLGWALGSVIKSRFAQQADSSASRPKVLIGKDTRISGYMFEAALEAGLCAAGVDPGLLGPMPTPAIAYLTRLQADAGIVISASHNPYPDNGFKFFSSDGYKLSDELEMAIEEKLDRDMHTVSATELGKAFRVKDAILDYQVYCRQVLRHPAQLKGIRLVVDCANGANYHIAPSLFAQLGAEVIPIHNEPDGLNINRGCGATAPHSLQAKVLAEKAHLGIAFDGDGDRLIMVDHMGQLVDGDELLFILASQYHRQGKLKAGIVGTQMSNFGLEKACQLANIPFYRAQVGDRHVLQAMQQRGALLGGESSGHLICHELSTTGDALIAALCILDILQHESQSLHSIKQGMQKYPQVLHNVPMSKRGDWWKENTQVQQALQDAERRLNGKGRVLLRASGTEPLMRIMVEGENADLVNELARGLSNTLLSVMNGLNQANQVPATLPLVANLGSSAAG